MSEYIRTSQPRSAEDEARLQRLLRGEPNTIDRHPVVYHPAAAPVKRPSPATSRRSPEPNVDSSETPTKESFKTTHPTAYKLGISVLCWHVGVGIAASTISVGLPYAAEQAGNHVPLIGDVVTPPPASEVVHDISATFMDATFFVEKWVWHQAAGGSDD